MLSVSRCCRPVYDSAAALIDMIQHNADDQSIEIVNNYLRFACVFTKLQIYVCMYVCFRVIF